jgi:hypothetical protein
MRGYGIYRVMFSPAGIRPPIPPVLFAPVVGVMP